MNHSQSQGVSFLILKEFAIDFPYQPQSEAVEHLMLKYRLTREEAVRLDYQENWKWKRREYGLQTRCMTAFFERLFPGMQTEGIWKIIVECVPVVGNERMSGIGGVLSIPMSFDLEWFLKSGDTDKKKITLDLLMQGIEKAARVQEWELSVFEKVADEIRAAEYRNEWVWKKAKHPETGESAEVLCQHSVQYMDLFLVIKDKNGIVKKQTKILSEQPDEFAYARHLGSLRWIKSHTVQLLNRKGQIVQEVGN